MAIVSGQRTRGYVPGPALLPHLLVCPYDKTSVWACDTGMSNTSLTNH